MELTEWRGMGDLLALFLTTHTRITPHDPEAFLARLNTHMLAHGVRLQLRDGFVIDALHSPLQRDFARLVIAETVQTLRSETGGYYRCGQGIPSMD